MQGSGVSPFAMLLGPTGMQIYAASVQQKQEQKVAKAGMEQAGIAAQEKQQDVATQLSIENTASAARGARIREELLNTLGEQQATLAARGIAVGGGIEAETRRRFESDLTNNRVNQIQAAADAATNTSRISNWLQSTNEQLALGYKGSANQLQLQKYAAVGDAVLTTLTMGASYFGKPKPFRSPAGAVPPGGGTTTGPGGLRGGGV